MLGVVADLAMALTLGALTLALLAGPPAHLPALRLGSGAAAVWALAVVSLTVLVTAQAAGLRLDDAGLTRRP